MPESAYLLISFTFGLFILSFASRQLTKAISQLFHRLTHSQISTIRLIAFIFLPGTFVHEFAHALMARLLRVPVGHLELWPEVEEQTIKLGSVQIAQTDRLRRSLIGVAPVLIGLILIVGSLFGLIYYFSSGGVAPWWAIGIYLYLLFVIGNTMFSSRKDLEGAVGVLSLILIISLSLYLLLVSKSPMLEQLIFNPTTNAVIIRANLNLLALIFADLILVLLIKAALRR